MRNSWTYIYDHCFLCYRYAKEKYGGVNFYQHFRKDFIRPYGLAHSEDAFHDATIARRLKTINCEFLLRPHIAISEFSETIIENWKYISNNIEIFDVEAIQKFLQKVEPVLQSLHVVNQKDTSQSGKTQLN